MRISFIDRTVPRGVQVPPKPKPVPVETRKPGRPKAGTKRADAMLMCECCKRPTTHCFAQTVPVAIRVIEVVYECIRCGTHRVWGREFTGTIDPDEGNDDGDLTL